MFPLVEVDADVTGARRWFLMHHALGFTIIHHDANGFWTWLAPLTVTGGKFWVLVDVRKLKEESSSREDFRNKLKKLVSEDSWRTKWKDFDVHVFHLLPGMIL